MTSIASFFAKVEGSAKGLINPEELFRSIITALGSGSVVGILILLLQTVLTNIGTILPDPAVASLASMVLALILDLLRRQNQGVTPAVTPSDTPVVVPVAPAEPVGPVVVPAPTS